MTLISCGIDHHSAPIELREKLAFPSQQIAALLQRWQQQSNAATETVILSTCNRTELYTTHTDVHALCHYFQTLQIDLPNLSPFLNIYHDADVVRHLLRVAVGVDSKVQGEPQIFGQLKQAYQLACETGTIGHHFQQLFPSVFAASKQIRTNSQIGRSPLSIAYITIQRAKHIFRNISSCHALLIGAGSMIEMVATYLQQQNVKSLTIANRSLNNAMILADKVRGLAARIEDVPAILDKADVIITATSSPLPILGKGMVESALKQRKHRPIFMADLSVPRDIEPEIGKLSDVYLYNLDDLQSIAAEHLKNRQQAAQQAEAMIELHVAHYIQQRRIIDATDIIAGMRQQSEIIRRKELNKALEKLNQGHPPQHLLENLAHSLTQKLLHQPTIKLREAASEGHEDLLMLAKNLFALEE